MVASYIDAFIVKSEDLRAWANSEFLDRQHSRELKDWNHFGQLNRKFDRRFIDPNGEEAGTPNNQVR